MDLEDLRKSAHHYSFTATEKEEENRNGDEDKSQQCAVPVVFMSHAIVNKIEKGLGRFGRAILTRVWPVCVFTYLILGILCLGNVRWQNTQYPPGIFEGRENQARSNLEKAEQTFPFLNSWRTYVMFSGQNVLKSDCLEAAEVLTRRILELQSFKRMCQVCQPTSASVLKGLTADQIRILAAKTKNTTIHYKVFQLDETISLTDVNIKLDNVTAEGLQLTLYLKAPTDTKSRAGFYLLEDKLSKMILNMSSSLHCSISTPRYKNDDDKIWSVVSPVPLRILYSALVLLGTGMLLVILNNRCALALIAFLTTTINTAICSVAAFGVFSLVLIPFHSLFLLVPFYVYCISLFNCFLLVRYLDIVSHWNSLSRRIEMLMIKAGFLIALSGLSIALLSGISIISALAPVSQFPAISRFFGLLFLTVVLASFATFLIVIPVLIWYSRRCRKMTPSHHSPQYSARWAKIVTSVCGSVTIGIICVAVLSGCLYFFVYRQPQVNIRTEDVFYLEDPPSKGEVNLVIQGKVEYRDKKTWDEMLRLTHVLESTTAREGRVISWMSSFIEWSKARNKSCRGNLFNDCLDGFLNETLTNLYRKDVKTQAGIIVQSRLYFHAKSKPQPFIKTVDEITALIEKSQLGNFETTVVSKELPASEDAAVFSKERLNMVALSLGILFLILLATTANPLISFALILTFVMLTMELLALVDLFNASLNQLTFICTFPALIIAFSLSVVVSQAFSATSTASIKRKVSKALVSTLKSLLSGVTFCLIASIALAFIFPYLAVLFLKVIPAFLLFASAHAFAFMPLLFSIYGKLRDCFGYSKLQHPLKPCSVPLPLEPAFPTSAVDKFVAVIGIGCRFPQAPNKDEFWTLLREGRCTVSSFPENREPEYKQFVSFYNPRKFVKGRICTMEGSYMENFMTFDAAFFKISNQEVNSLDPQQRILLEVVYEAIEDSGMKLEDLQACRTGVFVGAMNVDIAMNVTDDYKHMDQFSGTGMNRSIIANRISFCFNLTGPSFTVDTACSSSLTALKLAINSLQSDDCEVAIVCAPNLILSHVTHMAVSIAGLMSQDGRCRCFDASGDGYGRGEGFAAVILKLKDRAVNDGDDIYCEVVACGFNNDGATAMPITAPSSKSQSELFKVVLEKSGLQTSDIDYIEAHGTGTAIGDMVETTSISKAYCESSARDQTLKIGSVKSNINHTDSTSGLAGLIKLALMIKNKCFVPSVNVHNPRLDLAEKGLSVQRTVEKWDKEKGKPRIGAVSSYGFGGSNVHAIVREVINDSDIAISSQSPACTYFLTLSARTEGSLHDAARTLGWWITKNEHFHKSISDICYSLNERRTHHSHRMAISFESVDEAIDLLKAFGSSETTGIRGAISGAMKQLHQKLVFMFGGQGSQWYGMGRQMIEREPTFRATILEVDRILKSLGEKWNMLEELMASENECKFDADLVIGQTSTFAIQYSMAQLLIVWGIYPSAVIGHSLGEFAAACIAGAISLKDAVAFVLLRARLQSKCPTNGAMAALGMGEQEATALLRELKLDATVNVAAVNDAKSVTLSGDARSIDALGNELRLNNNTVFWKVLNTPRAFHSFHIALIKYDFQKAARKIDTSAKDSAIGFYSTVTGDVISGKELSADYWWRNAREPVKFKSAVRSLLRDGHRTIIEIGAQPTLAHYVKQIVMQEHLADSDAVDVLATLPRKTVQEQHKTFLLNTVCRLYCAGYPVKLSCVCKYSDQPKFIRLPNYSWQEKEYVLAARNLEEEVAPIQIDPGSTLQSPHPFLGEALKTKPFSGLLCWETDIDFYRLPFLKDRGFAQGVTVIPGATYLEMAFAMAKEVFLCDSFELTDVKLLSYLELGEGQVQTLRLRLMKQRNIAEAEYHISSLQDDGSERLLSSGKMRVERQIDQEQAANESEPISDEMKALMRRMRQFPMEEFHALRKRFSLSFGPSFSLIQEIWKGTGEALCVVRLDDSLYQTVESYIVHPCILDACLQLCLVSQSNEEDILDKVAHPSEWEKVTVFRTKIPRETLCHVTVNSELGHYDILLLSTSGQPLVRMKYFLCRELKISDKLETLSLGHLAYNVRWLEESLTNQALVNLADVACFVLNDTEGHSTSLTDTIRKHGAIVVTHDLPESMNFSNESEEQQMRENFTRCLRLQQEQKKKLIIVNCWPVETNLLPEEYDAIDQAQNISLRSSLFLLKLLIENSHVEDVLLVLLTHSQQSVGATNCTERPIPWSSTIWGARRAAALETTKIKVKVIDLSLQPGKETDMIVNELSPGITEDEVAFRQGKRFVSRIIRLSEDDVTKDLSANYKMTETDHVYMVNRVKYIALRANSESKILPCDVDIEVCHVCSINRKPSDFTERKVCVGFSGVVKGVGSSNSLFKQDDKVCGIVNAPRIGNRIRVSERQLMLQPLELTTCQSATIPFCAVLTSAILGRVTSGKKNCVILVHEADSGVAFTATAVAKALGHKVICTLFQPDNKDVRRRLLDIGADEIVGSHFLPVSDKYDGICDIVLFFTFPHGGALPYSYTALKTNGKLVIACSTFNEEVVLPLSKSISYERTDPSEIDWQQTFEAQWKTCHTLLARTGVVKHLFAAEQHSVSMLKAIDEWNIAQDNGIGCSDEAHIFKSFHFGKERLPPILLPGVDQFGLKRDRAYIVAGGVRGFGFEIARWMASNRAHTIILVGRSPPTEQKQKEVKQLEEETGAKIIIHQVDLSDEVQMGSLEEKLSVFPSVAGIVLTAVVLKDALISTMQLDSYRDVLAPKVKGAFILHKMSLKMNLDFFVMFSSVASVVGNAGQASYCAANAFLDSLAHYRRQVLGLPGLAVNWGPIGGTRILSRDSSADLLERAGFGRLDPREGAALMFRIMSCQPSRSQVSLAALDCALFKKHSPTLVHSTRFEALRDEFVGKQDCNKGANSILASRILMERDLPKRDEMIEEFVYTTLSSWTGTKLSSETDAKTGLYSYVFDSNAALKLQRSFEAALNVSLEMFYFMQTELTFATVVKDLQDQLRDSQAGCGLPPQGDHTRESEENELNPDSCEALLRAKVVPVHTPDQSEVKFFCVHPSHRYAMSVAPFAAGFKSQDLVSMYAIGLTEPTERGEDVVSVRHLAQEYIALIRTEQKHGPYFLGGYSFGGLVAYEMACILTELNEGVGFVAMIDTFPWIPHDTALERLGGWFVNDELSHLDRVEVLFDLYLANLAVKTLQMTDSEWKVLQAEKSVSERIEILQRRSCDLAIPLCDLRSMWDTAVHHQTVAQAAHLSWQPAEVQYKGPVTYIRSEDPKFSTIPVQYKTPDKAWSEILIGPTDVYVCPGHHFLLNQLPYARFIGNLLVNSISIRYRTLFPELYRFALDYKAQGAVRKFIGGVDVKLYSKKARKPVKAGKLFVDDEKQELRFTMLNKDPRPGKTIRLKDVRAVLVGRYASEAIKIWCKRRKNGNEKLPLLHKIITVIGQRLYNFEFAQKEDVKLFVSLVEGMYNVRLLIPD